MPSKANLSDFVSHFAIIKVIKYTAVYCCGANKASEHHNDASSKGNYEEYNHLSSPSFLFIIYYLLSIGNRMIFTLYRTEPLRLCTSHSVSFFISSDGGVIGCDVRTVQVAVLFLTLISLSRAITIAR